ncbi:LOW QUALITY PROTEIN: predicted protein, partial [Streptomyces sviceus ATCC 29083]
MRGAGARRAVVTTTVLGALLIPLGGCGGPGPAHPGGFHTRAEGRSADKPAGRPTRIPDVGDRLQRRIPAASRQVVVVYGDGKDSPDATVVLYTRHGFRLGPGPRLARAQRQEGLDHRSPRG